MTALPILGDLFGLRSQRNSQGYTTADIERRRQQAARYAPSMVPASDIGSGLMELGRGIARRRAEGRLKKDEETRRVLADALWKSAGERHAKGEYLGPGDLRDISLYADPNIAALLQERLVNVLSPKFEQGRVQGTGFDPYNNRLSVTDEELYGDHRAQTQAQTASELAQARMRREQGRLYGANADISAAELPHVDAYQQARIAAEQEKARNYGTQADYNVSRTEGQELENQFDKATMADRESIITSELLTDMTKRDLLLEQIRGATNDADRKRSEAELAEVDARLARRTEEFQVNTVAQKLDNARKDFELKQANLVSQNLQNEADTLTIPTDFTRADLDYLDRHGKIKLTEIKTEAAEFALEQAKNSPGGDGRDMVLATLRSADGAQTQVLVDKNSGKAFQLQSDDPALKNTLGSFLTPAAEGQVSAESRSSQLMDSTINMLDALGMTPEALESGEIPKMSFDPAGVPYHVKENLPLVGNFLKSPNEQQYSSSLGVIVENILRIHTGAAAPETEVKRYLKIFSPRAGDEPETVSQKLTMLANFASEYNETVSRASPGQDVAAEMRGHIKSQMNIARKAGIITKTDYNNFMDLRYNPKGGSTDIAAPDDWTSF